MSSLNSKVSHTFGDNTFNGARAIRQSDELTLKRLTLASLLWEDSFYVNGQSHAEIVAKTVAKCAPDFVAELAKNARTAYKLRHIPLLLMRELARAGKMKASDLTDVIQRPDEMGEFLAIYNKDGKKPLSNQVKKGLAKAFSKFNEFSLAKWDKNSANYSLRDVMFLTHPTPAGAAQEALFKKIANQELETPDTWETQLSAGADKRETFERLMREKKLGALAYLRNLRNMVQAGVPDALIRSYGVQVDATKVLPFRYLSAANIVPQFKDILELMMFKSLAEMPKLPGKTVLLVDVSGSMFGTKVSAKSDLDRFDAAAALAILLREVCEQVEIYSFASNGPVKVRDTRGLALVNAIRDSQPSGGTEIGKAVKSINANVKYDRIMVFTDEQSSDAVPNPKGIGYMINVASYKHSVASGSWESITGFSEAIVSYIQALELDD